MNLTLDSSLLVEIAIAAPYSDLCLDLLRKVHMDQRVNIYEPSLFLFEVINAMTRASQDKPKLIPERIARTQSIIKAFKVRPKTYFTNIDISLWENWMKSASQNSYAFAHKTQDDIFMHVACVNKAVFVTLDQQLIQKPICSTGSINVISPYSCLRML